MKELAISETEEKALAKALHKVDFFSAFTNIEFQNLLPAFALQEFNKNETIFKSGNAGNGFYIVYKGEVDIFRKKLFFLPEKKIATLKAGQFFGEMALLDNCPRTATAITPKGATLFFLHGSDFSDLFDRNRSFKDALKKLAKSRNSF